MQTQPISEDLTGAISFALLEDFTESPPPPSDQRAGSDSREVPDRTSVLLTSQTCCIKGHVLSMYKTILWRLTRHVSPSVLNFNFRTVHFNNI